MSPEKFSRVVVVTKQGVRMERIIAMSPADVDYQLTTAQRLESETIVLRDILGKRYCDTIRFSEISSIQIDAVDPSEARESEKVPDEDR